MASSEGIGASTLSVRKPIERCVMVARAQPGLDADLGDMSQPIPSVPGSIIHMGDGSAEYVFEDVGPGDHRIIAVVADGLHVPLMPLVVDTVTFTVHH